MINAKEFIVPNKPKKDEDEDPLKKPKLVGISGPTGSGKSILLLNLLNHLSNIHDFDQGLYVTANERDTLLDHIDMPITSSPTDLEMWMEKVKQKSEEPKWNILVLDDLQGSIEFNAMANKSSLLKFIISHRHFGAVEKNGKREGGTYVIFTSQRLKNSFSPTIKDNVNAWFIFNPRNQDELKEIYRLADDPVKAKKAMGQLKIDDNKHQFLYINKDSRPTRYFLGFKNELTFD